MARKNESKEEGGLLLYEDDFTDGSRGWVVEDRELPGVVGYGPNKEDARESFFRAKDAYRRALQEGEQEGEPGPS